MIYSKQKNKGFTILETLVAITIILIAITGPLDIIAHSLKASYYSRDEVTAFYLAQEAIEYARNQRDDNELALGTSVDGWLSGVTNDSVTGADCLNDANQLNQKKCVLLYKPDGSYEYKQYSVSGPCEAMRRYGDTKIYGASNINEEESHFTREIYFTKVLDSSVPDDGVSRDATWQAGQSKNEVVVTVNVTWTNNFGSNNKFTLSTRLYNWKITE